MGTRSAFSVASPTTTRCDNLVPMSNHPDEYAAIDGLLLAFTTQATEDGGRRFSADALEHLTDQGRAPIKVLLESIGHMVHYDSTGENNVYAGLAELFDQLVAGLRSKHTERNGFLPGDLVEIVVARPDLYLAAGARMRVYWVGDDETIDLGYESLSEDFVISTVRASDIRKCGPVNSLSE